MHPQELWYNADKDKSYILKNGRALMCDIMGKETKFFVPYCTGHLDYKKRIEYSTKTGMKHLIPVKPSYEVKEKAFDNLMSSSGIKKMDGYAQFPRPLYETLRTKPSERKSSLQSLKNDLLTKPLKTVFSFITQKSTDNGQSKDVFQTDSALKTTRESTDVLGLPAKKTMSGSRIKLDYLSSMKPTFRAFNNMANLDEKVVTELLKKNIELKPIESDAQRKSFTEIQKKLKKEEAELWGYQSLPEPKPKMQTKGLYQVQLPSEGELFLKSSEKRRALNPYVTAEELKYAELDMKLLKKRREQQKLKYNVMKSMARLKLKQLAKDLKLDQ